VPFSWFIGLGTLVAWQSAPAVVRPAATFVIDELLVMPAFSPVVPAGPAAPAVSLSLLLGAVWLIGLVVVVLSLWRQWQPIRIALRQATPISLAPSSSANGLMVVSSPSAPEPGIVGMWRSVLLLPDGLRERLTPAQLRAVVLHERCHIQCC